MGKLDRVTFGLWAVSVWGGCSSGGSSHEAAAFAPPPRTQAPPTQTAPRDDRFDAAGELLPSGQRASWLELPRGFRELPGSNAQLRAYEAKDIPLAKARAYLAARLRSEDVDYPPAGVVFHAARATYTQLPLPALNVRLLEARGARGELSLWIEELPEAVPPLPMDVAQKELARMRDRLE